MSAKDRPPEPWASFLATLDAAVGTAVEIHCLGGFMVEHAYRIQRDTPTEDLDVISAIDIAHSAPINLESLAGKGTAFHRQHKSMSSTLASLRHRATTGSASWPYIHTPNGRTCGHLASKLMTWRFRRSSATTGATARMFVVSRKPDSLTRTFLRPGITRRSGHTCSANSSGTTPRSNGGWRRFGKSGPICNLPPVQKTTPQREKGIDIA